MDIKKAFESPGVYTDTVTELSKKLIEANNKLRKSENERTAMIENISHDLRAPLTAIRSAIDYCKEKSFGENCELSAEEFKSLLGLMDKRVSTLEMLIQDLYLMTCIESGREEFKFEKIPFFQFLEEYYFAVEIDTKFKDFLLTMDIPEETDAMVEIDIAKMNRVLDNLFTNARKYSEKGARITLGAGKNENGLFFYVEDTGIGIPKEVIPFVFDRTYKVAVARTPSDESSSGLGLAISKSIILLHGGDIKCESTEGKGSRFTVTLPEVTSCS